MLRKPRVPRANARFLIVAVVAAALGAGPLVAPAEATVPVAIDTDVIASGLTDPAGFTFAPDGLIFYGERETGDVRIIDPVADTNKRFVVIPNISTHKNQGLLGIALHPDYPAKPYVYAYASRDTNHGLMNQILRYTDDSGKGIDRRVTFESSTNGPSEHDGGRILFGPDGFLYVVVGDREHSPNAQNLSVKAGKILRMTPNGNVPSNNPFGTFVWAYGVRNSFGFAFDPENGRLWESEAGPACNDEINRVRKGVNLGWGPSNVCTHPPPDPENTNQDGPSPVLPVEWLTPVVTPVGIVFCPDAGCGLPGHEGHVFFITHNTGDIREATLTPDRRSFASPSAIDFTLEAYSVRSMERGPDGFLYLSDAASIRRLVSA